MRVSFTDLFLLPAFFFLAGGAIAFAVGFSALAHVTLEHGAAKPGSFYKAVLQVTHGCDGSPTQSVRVEIPEGLVAVRPMPKPGWQIELANGPYAKSYRFHGHDVSEGVKAIIWSGGSLPDNYFDEFVFSAYVPATLAADSTLYFKVVQTCASGEMRWTETPSKGARGKLDRPAPSLKLLR